MISSILWLFEMILSFIERIIRDELFIYKNVCKKVLFDDFFFLYIYFTSIRDEYGIAKNLFDDRLFIDLLGDGRMFQIEIISTI